VPVHSADTLPTDLGLREREEPRSALYSALWRIRLAKDAQATNPPSRSRFTYIELLSDLSGRAIGAVGIAQLLTALDGVDLHHWRPRRRQQQ
jgi:hypothetical protein